jgi:PST family polysaccharide transporter
VAALALPVTSFQTMAQLGLERELRFDRLAWIEVVQAIGFSGALLGLALAGLGALGFGIAVLVRALIGALAANFVSPWRIGLAWDSLRTRRLLRFGLPYQGGAAVSLLKDSITPVFIGLFLGRAAVGYLNWAQMVAAYPVLALMALQRVYLPSFARLQSDRDRLCRFVEESIWVGNVIAAPLAILTLVLAGSIVHLAFGDRWMVALPLFYWMWGSNLLVPTAIPAAGLLNALGRSDLTFAFSVLCMIETWAFGIPGVLRFGAAGFAAAYLLVQASNVALIHMAQRQLPFRVRAVVWRPWAVAVVVGAIVVFVVRAAPPDRLIALAGYALGALTAYSGAMLWLYRGSLRRVSQLLRATA